MNAQTKINANTEVAFENLDTSKATLSTLTNSETITVGAEADTLVARLVEQARRKMLEKAAARGAFGLMALSLAACKSDDGSPLTVESGQSVSGLVIKGPLQGAFVFADLNNDGIFSVGEPNATTATDGSYTLTGVANTGFTVIATTSSTTIDSSTGLVLDNVTLKAPAGSAVITPITTLIEETGLTASAVATALGVPDGVDVLSFNPYAVGVDAATALSVENLSQQIVATMRGVAAAAEGAGLSRAVASDLAIKAVAGVVTTNAGTAGSAALDFSNAATITTIVNAAATAAVTAGADETRMSAVKDAVSSAISNVNDKISTVTDLTSTASKAIFATSGTLASEANAAATAGTVGSITLNEAANVDSAATALEDDVEAAAEADSSTGSGTGSGSETGDDTSTETETGDDTTTTGGGGGEGNENKPTNDTPTGAVTITGTVRQGETLTADASTLADADGLGTLSYQWKANGTNIAGASSDTLTLTQAEVGKVITVAVSYTDDEGTAETVTSSAVSAVENLLVGDALRGEALSVQLSSYELPDISEISFEWLRNGEPIKGANDNVYVLTQVDVGKQISVTLSYVDHSLGEFSISSQVSLEVQDTDASQDKIVTWKSDEVIYLSSNFEIGPEKELIIEPGAIIFGNSYDIQVWGELISGETDSPKSVVFNDVNFKFGSAFGTPGYMSFTNTEFIAGSFLQAGGNASYGSFDVADSSFTGTAGFYIWYPTSESTFIRNVFLETNGISVGTDIRTRDNSVKIENNVFKDIGSTINGEGVIVSWASYGGPEALIVKNNSFLDLDKVALEVPLGYDSGAMIATHNYFGTTEISQIEARILDQNDSFNRASVIEFEPILEALHPNTPGLAASEGNENKPTNNAPTGSVTITGTVRQGETLTADASTLADADGLGDLSYQWKANGTNISDATASTFTLTQAEVGKVITVAVSYTDGEGTAETISSVFIPDVINLTVTVGNGSLYGGSGANGNVFYINSNENPSLTLIRGNTYIFDQSNVTNGNHPLRFLTTDNASYTEGVTANGTPGTLGATITFIVPADAPDGLQYYCTVHGKGMGGAIATEHANVVANINDSPTGAVTITGTVRQGETLTADASTLADADGLGDLSYQWKANGTNISDATASTFTLTQAEVGKVITVGVSYTDDEGTAESVLSAASAAVTNINDPVSGAVLITGTATQGQILTADASGLSDPDGVGAFSYVWKADGTPISGATASTYTLTQAEVGKTVTVTASYTDGGGTVESVQSSATSAVANVNDAPTGSVTITGTVRQGETLTADASTLADADGLGAFSYQWKANGTNIAGASSDTLTLTQAEVGKVITVGVSYTDGGGTVETVPSSATSAVQNVNEAPVITSAAPLSVTKGNTYTYQLSASDVDIGDQINATATTLPNWLSFNPETLTLTGTPSGDHLGASEVTIEVSDGTLSTSQSFAINVNNAIGSVIVLVDQFSDQIFDLGHENLTLYDYGELSFQRGFDYQYNGFNSYDYWEYIITDPVTGFFRLTPDEDVSLRPDTFIASTTKNFDFDLIDIGVGFDPFWGDYVYHDYSVFDRLNQSPDDLPNHGDWALEALLQQLENPAKTAIIAVDLDTLNGSGSHYGKLFDLVAFSIPDVGVVTGTVIEKILYDWYGLNDYRLTGNPNHSDYSLSALSISIAGEPASAELPTLELLAKFNVPIVQSAPNITFASPFDWSTVFNEVISVGAWNVDSNGNVLFSNEVAFETVDILADGLVIKADWGPNFGTSFATPRVAAEITNFINNIIEILETDGTSLGEALQDGAELEIGYSDLIASIIGAIGTSVSFKIDDSGDVTEYLKMVLSDDLEPSVQPNSVNFYSVDEEVAWGVITEIEVLSATSLIA